MNDARWVLLSIFSTLVPGVMLWGALGAATGAPSPSPTATFDSGSFIDYGLPFIVSEGETAVVDDVLSLTFSAVTEDSRCPTDVQCIWEGNAIVELGVAVDDGPTTRLYLDTNPGFGTIATYDAYTIGLLGLEPYPATGTPRIGPYRATLVIDSMDTGRVTRALWGELPTTRERRLRAL
jgi:hypothetical protein